MTPSKSLAKIAKAGSLPADEIPDADQLVEDGLIYVTRDAEGQLVAELTPFGERALG